MTPNDIAQQHLPAFFAIGPVMDGVKNDKASKDVFTAVLVATIAEAYTENAKLAEAVAPLKSDGTHNEYTDIIAEAIRHEGRVT